MTEKRDYRDTVFLPKTDFPMKAGLPAKEPGILSRWQDEGLYRSIRTSRAGAKKFILHDGPPYANGDIHIGHALNKVLKDAVVRTQTLLGKDAPYVPGWDCHGLPIEWKVEELYRKKKLNKDEVPPREFRAECRAYAARWVEVQREQFKRLGILGEWDDPYLTMAPEAEAGIVAELLKFAESGQLYRGAKPVMWSPVEKTALAEAEVEYEDIVSTQVDVAFEIVESPIAELVGAYAVIWTTTPWTIPVNQALAYGPEVEYMVCRVGDRMGDHDREAPTVAVLIAAGLVEQFASRIGFRVVPMRAISGSQLAGTIARHPMHHLGGFYAEPRPLLPGDFVTTDSGTGLVHMAPDHGEDDFLLCKEHGINPKFVVEADGRYREDWAWLPRIDERSASVINPKFNAPDGPVCSDLKLAGGLLAASTDYKHSYPHSWRSKAKVIFRCTPQWFVPMDTNLPSRLREGPGVGLSAEGSAETFPPLTPPASGRGTLRETALSEIAKTRFVPEKGQNRIRSMVEGRPDWVLSRQRAWGVPITLFVDRKTGEYLVDAEVNARIIAAILADGVDGWCEENSYFFLNGFEQSNDAEEMKARALDRFRDPDDYEMIVDILDVWFDSGSTHAFVLESGRWPDLQSPADLYLEGSDQHRGWFQSSLLESCATRGRAPYKAVLTHGFSMAADGRKMSKSLGNTTDPLKVMEEYGADIIRLWALSVDYTEDHRIGPEILKGVADQYRKLRNTFRYLLGALEGFSEAERLPVAEMPELERYVLALLGELDGKLRQAVEDYDFNTYTRALSDFCNEDLSAFYFDIRKDSLYCDAPTDPKRMACRTVLDRLFHALIRYAAPVLVFTAEEVWGTRFQGAGSVHLLEWPEIDPGSHDRELAAKWDFLRGVRQGVYSQIETLRRDKVIGSSLEVEIGLRFADGRNDFDALPASVWAELLISSKVYQLDAQEESNALEHPNLEFATSKTTHQKCGRCWRHLPEVTEDGDLCNRCETAVAEMDASA